MKHILPFLFFIFALAIPANAQPTPVPVAASVNVAIGAKAEFFAEADGNPAPTFEWFKNGVKVADGATFVIAAGSANDAGTYHVKATNEVGFSVSQPFKVTVFTGPGTPAVKVRVTLASGTNAANSSGMLKTTPK